MNAVDLLGEFVVVDGSELRGDMLLQSLDTSDVPNPLAQPLLGEFFNEVVVEGMLWLAFISPPLA
ncbi:Uncharacterised protein [Mycobacteroides abscessus subsp. abscessus]|nr:Uncharacterised protein [Mycobacteroides abscessus subsp. abscessus]